MRIEDHDRQAPWPPLLQAADQRQRHQVVAADGNRDASGRGDRPRQLLATLERVIAGIDDTQLIRQTGEVELGRHAAVVLERVDHARLANGVRRCVGTMPCVEGFRRW